MGTTIPAAFPDYAPARARRRRGAPALLAVALVHAALGAIAYDAARPPPRPLAAPLDTAQAVAVLLLPEGLHEPTLEQLRAGNRPHTASDSSGPAQPARTPPVPRMRAREDVDARYVASGTLDIGPVPAGAPDLAAVMRRPVSAGKVVLRVYVSVFGLPDRVEILGKPVDDDFALALRRALEQTSFLPGRRDGRDIAAYVDYEFQTDIVVLPPPSNRRPS